MRLIKLEKGKKAGINGFYACFFVKEKHIFYDKEFKIKKVVLYLHLSMRVIYAPQTGFKFY